MSGAKNLLVNRAEVTTYSRLQRACSLWDANVSEKPRMADVLPIERSGTRRQLYTFALQAHFDFVVRTGPCHKALFAVEFDGEWHRSDEQQRRRDAKKDSLCEQLEFPLLRIGSAYLHPRNRRMDMLTWLVEVWFMQRAFDDAQEEGTVAWDEGFSPSLVSRSDYPNESHPFWLSADIREKISVLHEKGRVLHCAPAFAVGRDQQQNHYAIAYALLTAERGVIAGAKVRRQNFDVPIEDLLEDLALLELDERLDSALRGGPTRSWTEMERRCLGFRDRFYVSRAGGPVPNPLFDSDGYPI